VLFQTLDDKGECIGIYANDTLIFNAQDFPTGLKTTWSYTPYLRDLDVEFISLYLEGQSVEEILPEYLQDDWGDARKRLSAFNRCLRTAQVNQADNCFYDLVPQRFLVDFCEAKNRITQYVAQHVQRPERYDFYKYVHMMLRDIANHRLSLNTSRLKSYTETAKLGNYAKKLLEGSPYVVYKQFGTRTGRLTTAPDTFPILTIPQELRSCILPSEDYFLEIDFNGAEIRTLLGLLGKEQPEDDVHQFHIDHIFGVNTTREIAKRQFFAWLYGSSNTSPAIAQQLARFYTKDVLLEKYWDGTAVSTPYGKHMKNVSRHHALNYLVQSTAAELTLKQALKINYLLSTQGKGSRVAFIVHDSVVLDMKKEDNWLLNKVFQLMESTNFGKFKINISKGSDLGNIQEYNNG
jgi:hypothetical protein